MRITFRADGIPKGQPRARAVRRGGITGVYDPGTADGWKAIVAAAARPVRPAQPTDGPVAIAIDCFFPRPKRLMRKRDPEEPMPHLAKPDGDNLAKAILDTLTQDGWWRDDALVFSLIVRKFYTRKDGRPGAEITIVLPGREG